MSKLPSTFFFPGATSSFLRADGSWAVPGGTGGAGGDGFNRISAGTEIAGSIATIVFSDSNNVSFGMSDSSRVTASASFDLGSISAGTASASLGQVIFSNANGLEFGLDGQTVTGSYTVPTVTNSSWTASDGATSLTISRLAFTEANGITMSLSTAAGAATVRASHNALTSQSDQAFSAQGGSSTFQTLSFSNANGISFSNSDGQVRASHNALTSQSNQALSGSNGSFTFQTATFSNANGVTFGTSAGPAITASVNTSYAPSNHSHGNPTLALTNLSGTTASASDGLTLSLSAAAAGGGDAIRGIAAGGATRTTSTVNFSNANGISFGFGAAGNSTDLTASHNALTSQSNQALSGQNGSFTFQTASFSNANGISFGTSAGPAITASHNALTTAAQSNHSHGNPTLALTNLSGTTASASSGLTLSLSAAAPGGGAFSGGVSTFGNTAGSTGVTGTRLVLVGSNNVTLSQSTDANGATISFIAPTPGGGAENTISYWDNANAGGSTATVNLGNKGFANATLWVFPFDAADRFFPGRLTGNTFMFNWSQSGSTATISAAHTTSVSFGVYTRANGSQLSLLNSVSTSYGGPANTANSTIAQGQRWLTFHSSQWSSQPVFSADVVYYGALWIRSAGSAAQTFGVIGMYPYSTASRSGTIGVNSASNTSLGFAPFLGIYNTSFTTAMPATIGQSQLNKAAGFVNFMPHFVINNLTGVI